MDRKKRFLNRILIVCGSSAVLLFAGYVFFTHRGPRHYYLPKGYTGWVTVRFEKPGTPALEEKDGVEILHIPSNGLLETSSKLHTGWSKDAFFYEGESTPIPKGETCQDQSCTTIHDLKEECMYYNEILFSLPEQCDTTLWDGAKISKNGGNADIRSGRKTLVHFYVSNGPQPFFFPHDTLTAADKVW
jgi:hypothetical protein